LISTPKSAIKVVIIPTDEEVMIARDCYKALENTLIKALTPRQSAGRFFFFS
jgi:hypothetical protein